VVKLAVLLTCPYSAWIHWTERAAQTCPFGTSQTPKARSLRQPQRGLQAWAVFPNHYHFVAMSPEKATSLTAFLKHLHSVTAIEANRWEGTTGNKVWFQFRDTALTYPESYDARLSYVHRNAVHYGIVREPSLYPWCSAGWFPRRAPTSLYKRIMALKIDRVNVIDDFEVDPADI